METNDVLFAFGLTLFAGLATGIGSLIAFFAKRTNKVFLSISLGFSAGVMIYVSMIEIFAEAKVLLIAFNRISRRETGILVYGIGIFCGNSNYCNN